VDARPDPKVAAERRRQSAESLVNGNVASRGDERAPVTPAGFSDFQSPYYGILHGYNGVANKSWLELRSMAWRFRPYRPLFLSSPAVLPPGFLPAGEVLAENKKVRRVTHG
jgi:hypothetical protein